jgi:hypothetical protein
MARCYHSVNNLFTDVSIVNSIEDLKDIDLLFISDPFYIPHRAVWLNDAFINYCNQKNIRVIIFYGEKILGSIYPDTIHIFNKSLDFKNMNYYVWDVDDSLHFNKKILRYCTSKYYEDKIQKCEKINKCIFIGQINTPHYAERREALSKINNYIETDILENFDGDWRDYLNLYSKYRFAFCPISGNYNGLALRFYEALLVGSIPIQQVRKNTLNVYSKEASFDDCIFFENIEDLSFKIKNIVTKESKNKIWLEDELRTLLSEDGII